MHYYQHNIGDYARDTGHLSVLEHGVYRLLIDWCYLNEKPITTEQAIRVSRGNPAETQSVLSEFFLQNADGWSQKRVTLEVAAYHEKALVNRKNGAKGGRPKPRNNPVGSHVVSESIANVTLTHKPITINQEPIKEKSAVSPHLLGIPEKLLSDFLEVRKAKRAGKLTETALKGLEREGQKAGLTTIEVITACVEYGWQGFNAGWYADRNKSGAAQSETVYQKSMRMRVAEISPSLARPEPGRVSPDQFFENLAKVKTLEITQ